MISVIQFHIIFFIKIPTTPLPKKSCPSQKYFGKLNSISFQPTEIQKKKKKKWNDKK